LATALHAVFHNLENLRMPLREALGVANVVELIGDDSGNDEYVQYALHAVAHHGQDAMDKAMALVDEALAVIEGTKPYREAAAAAEARLAAAEGDAP
jgi:hypothetical protein